jgi:hypothetical protein
MFIEQMNLELSTVHLDKKLSILVLFPPLFRKLEQSNVVISLHKHYVVLIKKE